MTRISRKPARRAAWAALAAGSAAALFGARPSPGQQGTPGQPGTPAQPSPPAVALAAPAAVTPPRTRVSFQFPLPAGAQLRRPPQLDIFDSNGKLLGVRPMLVTQQSPVVAGFFRLRTETWPAGTYQLAVEATLRLADGGALTAVSPKRTLVVPTGQPIARPAP